MDTTTETRTPATLIIVFVLATLGAAGLHALGNVPWLRLEPSVSWLRTAPAEEAIAAVARLIGLATAYWVLGSTLLYTAARLTRRARLVRLAGRITAAPLRRLVDGVVASALVVGLMSPPAFASDLLPVELAEQPPPPMSTATHLPADVPTGDRWSEVVVIPGDNLWRISARHLADLGDDRGVGPYWRRVVEANRPHLRSGDPDLIYPGEEIRLPPP